MKFKEAITAHAKWKITLANYLKAPDGSLMPEVVGMDNKCALGQWIHGDAIELCNAGPGYEILKAEHARFHRAAAGVINEINAKTPKSELALLGPTSEYGIASAAVIATLETFDKEFESTLVKVDDKDLNRPVTDLDRISWKLENQLKGLMSDYISPPVMVNPLHRLELLTDMLQSAVESSRSSLKQLLDNSGDGFLSVNAKGFFNHDYSRITEEFLLENPSRKPFSYLFDKEEEKKINEIVNDIFKPDSNFVMLSKKLPKEIFRNLYYLEFSYGPIRDESGKLIAFLVIIKDLTKIRKLQDTLEMELEQEKARSLNNAKLASMGEMSAGVAHEINNPLAIIVGGIQILEKLSHDPEKVKSRLEAMKKSCERIQKIVSGLKKFSRSTEIKECKEHSIRNIVMESVGFTELKANRNETQVSVNCITDAPIFCDEIEIGQVIINLISNAIDAVQNNSEKWVGVTVFESECFIVLQIRDSGKGISPTIATKIFQPFFTTKPVGEGTGLGLSISKGILDTHNASLDLLLDDPNTCFEIKFPKVDKIKDAA